MRPCRDAAEVDGCPHRTVWLSSMSETKKSNVVGIAVAVLVLLAVAPATGVAMYQHRGTVVFEHSQAFTGPVLRFAFELESEGEHAVLLTRRIHYTSAYEYRLALQLQLPSGQVLEREILDVEHDFLRSFLISLVLPNTVMWRTRSPWG